nr:hypothetical protein [Tanacetum cinerariifolium]
YIPGPEEPEQAPPTPNYVTGPEHADDEIAHPEDDDDEDPEEDPVDYLADGGDDGDDNEGSSEDDEDDDMDIKANEEEEEEHPAPADSVVVASTAADQALSVEETEPFETDESAAIPPPHPAYRMTSRISIPAPVPMLAWEDRPEVTLPPRKKLGIALGPGYEVGESSSAAAIPAEGLRADYGFVATMDREIMRDPERKVGYGITNSWDEIVEALQGAPVSTDTELGGYMREFETRVRQDTDKIYMSNCAVENQVKFATCTLHSVALTWWNTHVKTVGHDAAYGMPWKTLMKMMTEKYCPRNEIRKLEMELWDLKIEKYIRGLPDMIHESVVASKPKTMQEAIEISTELMDKKIRTFAERETASKRKFENTSRNTQNQQQHSNKRQNTGRVCTATSGEKKQYGGSKPLCAKCNYHHDGPCAPKCRNCNKIGHFACDCRSMANTNNANNQRGT